MTTSRRTRAAVALAAPSLLVLALAGCSTGSSDSTGSDSSSSDTGSAASKAAPRLAEDGLGYAAGSATDSSVSDVEKAADADVPATSVISVISTGTVSLRARDVGGLLLDVQQVVDTARGQITERSSETDDEGRVRRSHLVLRVPASRFGDTMTALEGLGALVSSDSTSEDVSTQVIDNDVRIRVQRASIDRIRALLAEATDLREVVAIEGQLSSREADLDSLEQTQAYLRDQSSRSTITVSLSRTRAPVAERPTDDAGFLSGLRAGWSALGGAGTTAATVAGAVLPWAVLAALLAVPGVPLTRRLRRRTSSTVAAP